MKGCAHLTLGSLSPRLFFFHFLFQLGMTSKSLLEAKMVYVQKKGEEVQ
jgi:hypothetical protein